MMTTSSVVYGWRPTSLYTVPDWLRMYTSIVWAEKKINLIIKLSGWGLVAPSCFEDYGFQTIWSHWSLALSTVTTWLPTSLLGMTPNSRISAEICLLPRKMVGLELPNPTGDYSPSPTSVNRSSQWSLSTNIFSSCKIQCWVLDSLFNYHKNAPSLL